MTPFDSSDRQLTPPEQGSLSNSASAPLSCTLQSQVSPWLGSIAYFLARYFIMPGYFGSIEVIGQENVPRTGAVILAPTHRSRWDALLVPYTAGRLVSRRDPRYMVSANEMRGLQGWFIRRLGGFPVNTDHPGISSFRHAVDLLRQGEMVVIFPEGGIFQDDQVHPLKPGLARIALQVENLQPDVEVKIVPMSLHYSGIIPRWRSKVRVQIGQPITVAEYLEGSVKKNTLKLTQDLEASLTQLDHQEIVTVNTVATSHPLEANLETIRPCSGNQFRAENS